MSRVSDVLSVRARNVLRALFAQTELDPERLNGAELKAGIERVAAWMRCGPQQAVRRQRHCGAVMWSEIALFAGFEVAPPHKCICRDCGQQLAPKRKAKKKLLKT